MRSLESEQIQANQAQQVLSLIARMEQANLLEMSEKDFLDLVTEVEASPLFKRLHREQGIVRYARVPGTDVASGFYELKPQITPDQGSLDVDSLTSGREFVVGRIREMGLENFKRYFLYPDPDVNVEEIARGCDLEIDEVQRIIELMDEFSILSEFYHPSAVSSEQQIHYRKIASVERRPEGLVIGYFSPSFARGKYRIDYERFEELERNGTFSEAEARNARRLLKKLEMINVRKDTIGKTLQGIVEKQRPYFESGDSKSLLPFSQKELSQKIGLAPSSVSRAISGKSIDTPWGEEHPLKHFFPRPSRFRRKLISQLLETETHALSDDEIRDRLEREFGVSISRRSVARLRGELRAPAASERAKRLSGSSEGS